MSKLKVADDLSLPLEAVTETFCIMAMRGKGKTHAASVMAEEMLKRQIPVVIYDPTGAWYGLKSSRDGKSAAFPVAVFGGEHADIPLEHTAGETVAKAIVDNRYAAILDCSLMRKGNRITFMAHFLEALYHYNREAMHLIVDEAHTIAPLSTREAGGDAPRALGAMEDIILQGRLRGIGCSSITQRPALLHTTVRTQSATLVAMGMSGPHDIKAVMEWVKLQASEQQAADMLASLPSLPRGDAWFWSPSAFDVFKRIHFRERETFDSSRTPKVGEARRVPKVLAAPDIQKLGDAIRATVETAKANDPKLLRAELQKLRGELQKMQSQKPAAAVTAKTEIKRVEVAVVKAAEVKRLESAINQLEGHHARLDKLVAGLTNTHLAIKDAKDALKLSLQAARREGEPLAAPKHTAIPIPRNAAEDRAMATYQPRRAATPIPRPPPAPRDAASAEPSENGITKRQQKFLDAAASLKVLNTEITRETLAGWIGIHPRGGSVGEELKALADADLIVIDRGGGIDVTEQGMAQATPLDAAAAIDRAKSGLKNRARNFFEVIVAAYPDGVTREQIAEHFQIHPRGGSLGEDLGRLVGRGLVESDRGVYRARDFLFATVPAGEPD